MTKWHVFALGSGGRKEVELQEVLKEEKKRGNSQEQPITDS